MALVPSHITQINQSISTTKHLPPAPKFRQSQKARYSSFKIIFQIFNYIRQKISLIMAMISGTLNIPQNSSVTMDHIVPINGNIKQNTPVISDSITLPKEAVKDMIEDVYGMVM